MSRRLKKERVVYQKKQQISDPSIAGRGEKKAVWTSLQTDGGAQGRSPTVLLQLFQHGTCHV